MNRFGSHLNYENRITYEGPPPQGPSEARRAVSFFKFLVTDQPHRKHRRGGAFIVPDDERGNNPSIIAE